MAERISGLDLHNSIFESLLHNKQTLSVRESSSKGYAGVSCYPKTQGTLSKIKIFMDQYYIAYSMQANIGVPLKKPQNNFDCIFDLIAVGSDKDDAFFNAKNLVEQADIQITRLP